MNAEQRAAAAAAASRNRKARRMAGVPSLREAIRAKCADCIFDPLSGGTALEQIRNCGLRTCPLWPHRPGAPAVPPDDYVPLTYAGVKGNIRRRAGRA